MGRRMQAARWRRGALCLCAVAAAVALWAARGGGGGAPGAARAELAARLEFPRFAPHALAHLLADFSALSHLAPHEPDPPGSWRVEEERGNYTSWWYRVTWACGARCAGSARVAAHAPAPHPAPHRAPHRAAAAHRVTLELRVCADEATACDEMEIRADVETDGAGGAVLRELAVASCAGRGPAAAAGGGEACAARLRRHRALHHAALRALAPAALRAPAPAAPRPAHA